MAIDGEYEYDISGAWSFVKQWKKSYFRKNSRKKAVIRIRVLAPVADIRLWKHWIEVSVDGKIYQQRITHDAFWTMKEEKDLHEDHVGSVSFYEIASFTPSQG